MGPQRRKPSYEALDECQWVLGFLRDREAQKDAQKRENISYLTELMQDAVDFGWAGAKGAHYVLMNRLIDGTENWAQIDSIQKLRERYTQTTVHKVSERAKDPKPAICFRYNKTFCTRVCYSGIFA